MKTYLQNYGVSKHVFQTNNKTSKHEMEWIGDYDGKNANLHLHVNDDGIMKEVQMKLDNNDLIDLLNIPVNKSPLEQRLLNDFLHPKKNRKTIRNRNLKKSVNKKNTKKSRRYFK